MLYGYKGKLLIVDLGQETYKTISIPKEILNKYIGGLGATKSQKMYKKEE